MKNEDFVQHAEIGNLLFGHARGEQALSRALIRASEWSQLLEAAKSDDYGYTTIESHKNARGGFENDVFAIAPYWWGDDDNEEECNRPNFLYKPTGLEIRWYKYPFRDSYITLPKEKADAEISDEKIRAIWKECIKSIDTKNL